MTPVRMAGPVVVALGDSITAGVGDAARPTGAHGPGWAGHLAALAGAERFLKVARNGARAADLADQLPRALSAGPDLATVMVGGNDVLRSDFSAREVASGLSTAVTALRDAGCAVVLARLPAIALFEAMPPTVGRVMRARVDAVNRAVDTVAQTAPRRRLADPRGSVVVLDVGTAVVAPAAGAWHLDRVHPSATGHRLLAAHAAQALCRAGVLDLRDDTGEAPTADELLRRLGPVPPAPSPAARLTWLAVAGLPWCVRRGRDFVPGLVRAVRDAARAQPISSTPVELTAE